MTGGMDIPLFSASAGLLDHRGLRRHRFMESADINAACRELFRPLRSNIRRGMTIDGQLYAFEVDACVPGQLLSGHWIPPATRGIDDPGLLADPARRQAVFKRLLAEDRAEALFAYVTERNAGLRPAMLYMELASADGSFAAEHLLRPGRGWHVRDLLQGPVRRVATG